MSQRRSKYQTPAEKIAAIQASQNKYYLANREKKLQYSKERYQKLKAERDAAKPPKEPKPAKEPVEKKPRGRPKVYTNELQLQQSKKLENERTYAKRKAKKEASAEETPSADEVAPVEVCEKPESKGDMGKCVPQPKPRGRPKKRVEAATEPTHV